MDDGRNNAWGPQPQPVHPPYPEQKTGGRAGRAVAITLTAVATLVSALAVTVLVVVLADRSQEGDPEANATPTTQGTGPVNGGAPPTGVTIVDRGTSVRVAWRDPTAGKYGFMVTMARAGQQLKPVAQVGPGRTQTDVIGLQPSLQYCFAVVAVYSTTTFATSPQVCTERK